MEPSISELRVIYTESGLSQAEVTAYDMKGLVAEISNSQDLCLFSVDSSKPRMFSAMALMVACVFPYQVSLQPASILLLAGIVASHLPSRHPSNGIKRKFVGPWRFRCTSG